MTRPIRMKKLKATYLWSISIYADSLEFCHEGCLWEDVRSFYKLKPQLHCSEENGRYLFFFRALEFEDGSLVIE